MSIPFDDYLASTQLLDCQGRVTHTFTLLADGTVRVRIGGRELIVDPATRRLRGPGGGLPPAVVDQACAFARSALG